jgi:hypothetical protein
LSNIPAKGRTVMKLGLGLKAQFASLPGIAILKRKKIHATRGLGYFIRFD